MTRPTMPPGPPYPEDDDSPEPGQPRFTPRQPGPQPPYEEPHEPPTYQGLPPYDVPSPPGYQQPSGGYDPYPPPPPAPRGPATGPSFTPHPPVEDRQGPRPGRGRGGKPRPTFTPREGYVPPPPASRARPAPMPTAFLPPVPAGYPQPSFQPFDYVDAPRSAPKFVPADRDAPPAAQDYRTRVIEPDAGEVTPTGPQRLTENTSPNLVRSSKVMAIGTLASRATGFLRTFVLVYALGDFTTAAAYNTANTLPNTVYYLFLGGVFTSIVVPLLVRAAKEDPDRGEGYAQRIYSLGVVSLLAVTIPATVLAGPIADLYGGDLHQPGEHRLLVAFAYFFIPQIFFYGMDSLLGAILNVRGRFGPNMWTPVINNVVVIFVGILFMVTARNGANSAAVSGFGLNLLGIGTTLGIVIQSAALFPIMWRTGFSMRLTFHFRREEIGDIGRMSGWMFGYVASQFLGNLVATRVANSAPTATGYSAYTYANQLFQLPYAIVGLSVISALLPRMSGHANERRYSLVRDDFSKGVRVASVIVVPAAVFLGVLGGPICEFLFGHGNTTTDQARYIGEVFGAFCVGLLPFMLTQLQLRVFYSFHESRTPAVVGMIMLVIGVIGYVIVKAVLPPGQIVVGLAFVYDIMTLAGAVIAWPLLLRHVGSLDGWRITRSLVQMFLATLPGLVFALVVMGVLGSFMHQGGVYGFITTVAGGGGALVLYAFCARVLGIEEFETLMKSVTGRFG
ncbi:MAG TPA: murein biosynthesis integral membrane protein MurJ [Trebonia sp.]|nr:murein biosynthesis integral membrane protein MurJ [Trebonia sp.]